MNRVTFLVIVVVLATACAKQPSQPTSNTSATPAKTESTPATTAAGTGQATGSYTAKGEVVELKYAYAAKAERFGVDSMVILLTDKPIPAEALAEEIKNQTLLQSGQLKGLEYAIDKDGMWVRFHPGQYQESTSMQLKDYVVEGDVVRGTDENDGKLSEGRYKRSVKFVATIVK